MNKLKYLIVVAILPLTLLVTAPDAANTRPSDDAAQVLQLESARFQMTSGRLDRLLRRLKELQREIELNASPSGSEAEVLESLIQRLQSLKENDVCKAKELLRSSGRADDVDQDKLSEISALTDSIAAELAIALLYGRADHALEAFRAETAFCAANIQTIYDSVTDGKADMSTDESAALLQDMRTRLHQFITESEARSGKYRYPLASVRLTQARSRYFRSDCDRRLDEAAQLFQSDHPSPAALKLAGLIHELKQLELWLEPNDDIQRWMQIHEELLLVMGQQRALIAETEEDQSDLSQVLPRQVALRASFEQHFCPPGTSQARQPVMQSLAAAESATDRADLLGKQRSALDDLQQYVRSVRSFVDEIAHLKTVSDEVRSAERRVRTVKRLIALQEDVMDQAIEGKDTDDAQAAQIRHIEAFIAAEKENSEGWSTRILAEAKRALEKNRSALEQTSTDELAAIDLLDQSVTILRDSALDLAQQDAAFLSRQREIGISIHDFDRLSIYLHDLELEQKDIRVLPEESTPLLATRQGVLVDAVGEIIADLLPVKHAEQLQVPLAGSIEAMREAIVRLENDTYDEAAPMQMRAEEQLREAQLLTAKIAKQYRLILRETREAKRTLGMYLRILERQIQIRRETEVSKVEQFQELTTDQNDLKEEAEVFAEMLGVGAKHFQDAVGHMENATAELQQEHREPAVKFQKKAEAALTLGLKEIADYLTRLREMAPYGDVEDPEHVEQVLLSVINRILAILIDQIDLRELTPESTERQLKMLTGKQIELLNELEELSIEVGESLTNEFSGLPYLWEAENHMEKAVEALKQGNTTNAAVEQKNAIRELRKAMAAAIAAAINIDFETLFFGKVAQQALEEDEEPPPESFLGAEIWVVFPENPEVGAPVGNLGTASWEGSLNDRERKSLYENFARELPVEYRDILSLYFQTLAEQPR